MKHTNPSFKVVGHRGAAGLCPENSLAAIQKALELGVDLIEIDVHQTKDREIVAIHDKTLDRTSNGKGKIRDFSLKEIQQFRLINPTQEEAYNQEYIPSLKEVLQVINGQAILLIEVKLGYYFYPDIEQNILTILEDYQANEWCILQSFDNRILKKFHALKPDAPLHKLFVSPYFFNFRKFDYLQGYGVSEQFASKRLADKVHRMNRVLNVWTVNKETKMQQLIDWGVDGLITDFPDKAMRLKPTV